jgi:Holliday junction resolvasome RuvABC endonuclease subunit
MFVSGIDYSITSPAFCIHEGKEWSFDNCKFFYLVYKDKFMIKTEQFKGFLYPENYKTQQDRFNNLSTWVVEHLKEHKVSHVAIEGYSYASTSSRLFEIGENSGLLKYKLWKENMNFEVYAPTAIKKFATGKGNSNKEKMWDSFLEETKCNIFNLLGQEIGKSWNPVSDIVDSYFICKNHHKKLVDISQEQ